MGTSGVHTLSVSHVQEGSTATLLAVKIARHVPILRVQRWLNGGASAKKATLGRTSPGNNCRMGASRSACNVSLASTRGRKEATNARTARQARSRPHMVVLLQKPVLLALQVRTSHFRVLILKACACNALWARTTKCLGRKALTHASSAPLENTQASSARGKKHSAYCVAKGSFRTRPGRRTSRPASGALPARTQTKAPWAWSARVTARYVARASTRKQQGPSRKRVVNSVQQEPTSPGLAAPSSITVQSVPREPTTHCPVRRKRHSACLARTGPIPTPALLSAPRAPRVGRRREGLLAGASWPANFVSRVSTSSKGRRACNAQQASMGRTAGVVKTPAPCAPRGLRARRTVRKAMQRVSSAHRAHSLQTRRLHAQTALQVRSRSSRGVPVAGIAQCAA